ncbi:MAG: acyl-CoA dehydrogenase family protein [Betaproteobacteria bacterium]|nr:acyl-CoA dehydrogenase family protein [Betaproteobacteria bacterium]
MLPAPTYDMLIASARGLVPVLRERALRAEELRRIPDETLHDLHASGLFRMLQPKRVGGSELSYEAMVELTAIIGRGCGSTAWVLANLANHHWMLALWPRATQDEIWGKSADTLVGSALTFPAGHAEREDGGFRLSGHWKFSSGIDASGWCMLGGIVASAQGEMPEYYVFILPQADYQALDTWHVAGLRGTGSKDIEVKNVFVPAHRALPVAQMKAGVAPGGETAPLYRLPVFDMFPYVVAGASLGIAQGAIEVFVEDTRHRITAYSTTLLADYATTQARLGHAAAAVAAAERILMGNCREAMEMAAHHTMPAADQKIRLRRDAAYAAHLCTESVDLLFGAGGGEFLFNQQSIQRSFRDVHAANSHYALAWDIATTMAGKSLLGIGADVPTL